MGGDRQSNMHSVTWLCLALPLLLVCSSASSTADQIDSLPGFGSPPSKHFSGFLELPSSAKKLHYYFVHSERNPLSDPVVLWLNGGPGCSSLDGLFYEQGPLLVNSAGTELVRNNKSWATVANMLYLEAPCGVGFSYSPDDADYSSDDQSTAIDNFHALIAFFVKFAEFKSNEFYISGESYAGVYVPMLAQQIFQKPDESTINMKGFMVGNGCFDQQIQGASDIGYLWGHGLIPNHLYQNITASCHDVTSPTPSCSTLLSQAEALTDGVNVYNTYGDCFSDGPVQKAPLGSLFDYKLRWSSTEGNIGRTLARRPAHPSLGLQNVNGMVPCIDSAGGEKYLNRADVKAALHVLQSPLDWALCSSVLRYKSEFGDSSMIPIYRELSGQYRMLVYNGDTDGCVNFMGSQNCVAAVGNDLVQDWHPWHVSDVAGPQVAGYLTQYAHNLSFITIRGAGHMVPQWKPAEALVMFDTFVSGATFK